MKVFWWKLCPMMNWEPFSSGTLTWSSFSTLVVHPPLFCLCVFLLTPTFIAFSPHLPGRIVPLVIRDHSNSQSKKDQFISLPPVLWGMRPQDKCRTVCNSVSATSSGRFLSTTQAAAGCGSLGTQGQEGCWDSLMLVALVSGNKWGSAMQYEILVCIQNMMGQ